MSSKTSKAVGKNGPPCPRCGRATQVRTHRSIGRKQLRQLYYYSRWFKCINNKCRTTLVVRREYIVWNPPPEASMLVSRTVHRAMMSRLAGGNLMVTSKPQRKRYLLMAGRTEATDDPFQQRQGF